MMATGLFIVGVILTIAALPVLYRIIAGPTMLDRAIGADMLSVILVMALGVWAAYTRSILPAAAMLAMTALAFLGTVAIARFVGRDDSAERSAGIRGGAGAGIPTGSVRAVDIDAEPEAARRSATRGDGDDR